MQLTFFCKSKGNLPKLVELTFRLKIHFELLILIYFLFNEHQSFLVKTQ